MKPTKKLVILAWMAVAATWQVSAIAGGWGARGDDCAPGTRNAKAEWGPAFCRSKSLESLDCAGLAAYAEATRHAENVRYLTLYQRPMLGAVPVKPRTLPLPPVLDAIAPTIETTTPNPPAIPEPRVP